MDILFKASQLILSLSILVVVHEFGHFLFAKLFKTRVEKFYLFFNPWFSLFKFKRGETEYGIGWLPLGGYVKISGMVDESMDKEQMKKPPQPWEFRSKKTWQRLLIMIGGVLVNLLFAFIVYIAVLFTWGEQYLPVENARYGIMCDSTGLQMGLRNGDRVISVDGKPVTNFGKIAHDIIVNNARKVEVERSGEKVVVNIPAGYISKLIKNPGFLDAGIPFIIKDFFKESVGKNAGLKANDQVIGFDSFPIKYYSEARQHLAASKGKKVQLAVLRGKDTLKIPVQIPADGLLQVYAENDISKFFTLKKIDYSLLEAIPAGINKTFSTAGSYLKQLKLIISPETNAYESLGGFISIGKIFPSVWDWELFWSWTAFLSIILAIMNLLPIPALDGGHVIFLLYEIVTRRKPSDKFLEYAQIGGMILLFGLLLFANGNDIIKLFK